LASNRQPLGAGDPRGQVGWRDCWDA